VRSLQKFFTHRPVSTFDRSPFQLTDELFLYGMALRVTYVRDIPESTMKPPPLQALAATFDPARRVFARAPSEADAVKAARAAQRQST
jgi:hypothetical protein